MSTDRARSSTCRRTPTTWPSRPRGSSARDVAGGARVTLLTLFEPPEAGAARRGRGVRARVRRRRSCAASGPTRWCGGGAIARRRSCSRRCAPTRRRWSRRCARRCRRASTRGCRRVVAPLGVGGHVDHQVAHAACRALAGAEVAYYEDTPYVLTPYQLPRRLARLDADRRRRARRDAGARHRARRAARGGGDVDGGAAHPGARRAAAAQAGGGGDPDARVDALAAALAHGPAAVRAVDRRPATSSRAPSSTRWPPTRRSGGSSIARSTTGGTALERYARAMGQAAIVERVWREVTPAAP